MSEASKEGAADACSVLIDVSGVPARLADKVIWIGSVPPRSWAMNASPSAGVHCHGYSPENSLRRSTRRTRGLIV